MLERIRRTGADLANLAGLRLELFGVELREQFDQWLRVCVLAVAAIALGCIALGFIAVLVTVALWDSHRIAALSVFSALFVVGAGWCARQLAGRLADAPDPFSATIAEFRSDRRALDPDRTDEESAELGAEAALHPDLASDAARRGRR
ncbi:MAG: hypothetical protein RIS35_825 [Pseudomonadota bacterium]